MTPLRPLANRGQRRLTAAALFRRLVCVASISFAASGSPAHAAPPKPTVWMHPPGYADGRLFRELFEHPEGWAETRSRIDVLSYTDLNFNKQFRDEELRAWFAQLNDWKIKLSLEVGAVKPWGKTGEGTFNAERPMWERIERLGGKIYAVAMDEPLVCVRKELKKADEFAVEETARYIAAVRQHFPDVRIGDIEAYPFFSFDELTHWIDTLQKRLADKKVRGLDFFRLDVDWVAFTAQNRGSWREVKQLEQFCRKRGIEFSLIYWASDYPALKRLGFADDSTWYVSMIHQAYAYAVIGGAPDQYMIESWIEAPAHCVPESDPLSFTHSVLEFTRRFVKRGP